MGIYYIVLSALVVLMPLCLIKKGKTDKKGVIIFLVLSLTLLFAVSALRINTGTDQANYIRFFQSVVEGNSSTEDLKTSEAGYTLFNCWLALFTQEYEWLSIITSAVFILLLADLAYRWSQNAALAVLFFYVWGFYFNSMNFTRQMLAAMIFFYAVYFAYKNLFLRAVIFAFFAATFHFSALLMIPFLFLARLPVNRITVAVYAAVTAAVYLFSDKIIGFTSTYVYPKYSFVKENINVLNGTYPIYAVLFSVVFIAAFIERKELIKRDRFNGVLINMAFFNVFYEFIGSKHSILSRPALYFGIISCTVLLPRLFNIFIERLNISEIREKKKLSSPQIRSVVLGGAVLVAAAVFFVFALSVNYNGVVPYCPIWGI